MVDDLKATFAKAGAPAGLSLDVAGPVADNVANQSSSQRAGGKVQGLSILFIIVLLFIIFRAVLAPIITLVPAALALVVSMRVIGELGAHGLQVSEITELLLIVLLLGAGTDYGLFLVFRVREELAMGRDPHDAVAHGLERVGESISASAGTVIFALLSLLLASFGIYHDLGVPLAIGIAMVLLAGLTLLPALLAIAGRAAFWPTNVQPGSHRDGWWGIAAARLLRRPALALTAGVLLFGGLAVAALSYRSGGFGGAVSAPAGTSAGKGDAALAANFPETSANPTNLIMVFPASVFSDPALLVRAEDELTRSGEFRRLAGPLNPAGIPMAPGALAHLREVLGPAARLPAVPTAASLGEVGPALYNAYRATAEYISADGKTVQFAASLRAGDPAGTPAIDAVPAIRSALAHVASSVDATQSGVAGTAPALYDVAHTSNADLVHIIPIAILAIGILLGLVLRSAVAPLYLIVSVALSYFAALGVSVLVFMDIAGNKGLTFILPFLMFVFLLALGEDYNILVMTRIREEAHRHDLRDAVERAVARSGPTITSAGLVLAGTFAVFAVAGSSGSGGGQIRAIGFGLAIGVLLDTFLVRTVIVPATVSLLGRANWWPTTVRRDGQTGS